MDNKRRIAGAALTSYFEGINGELGATNRSRLSRFSELEFDSDTQFSLQTVFSALFPGQEKSKAQESFKKLRKSVNEAAETVGCSLQLKIESSRSGET